MVWVSVNGAPSTVHAGSPMPDGKSAKKVIKGVLKQHKKGLSIEGLKKDVCKQLEAEGMTPKKAEKAFDAKIQLPIFEVKAGVARLVKNKDGDAAVAEPPKADGHVTLDEVADLEEVKKLARQVRAIKKANMIIREAKASKSTTIVMPALNLSNLVLVSFSSCLSCFHKIIFLHPLSVMPI